MTPAPTIERTPRAGTRVAARSAPPRCLPPGDPVGALVGHRVLTAAEEQDLARRLGTGDPRAAREAREALILHNLRLAVRIANRWPETGILSRDDLIGAAVEGLIAAVDRFDPRRGYRFSTYAVPWITQAIGRAVDTAATTIRVPRRVAVRLRDSIRHDTDDTPEDTRLRNLRNPRSLDRSGPGRDDGVPLGDRLADPGATDPAELVAERDQRARIRDAVASLRDPVGTVVGYRFGFGGDGPVTITEICRRTGMTEHRVRRIPTAGLAELRVHLTDRDR